MMHISLYFCIRIYKRHDRYVRDMTHVPVCYSCRHVHLSLYVRDMTHVPYVRDMTHVPVCYSYRHVYLSLFRGCIAYLMLHIADYMSHVSYTSVVVSVVADSRQGRSSTATAYCIFCILHITSTLLARWLMLHIILHSITYYIDMARPVKLKP